MKILTKIALFAAIVVLVLSLSSCLAIGGGSSDDGADDNGGNYNGGNDGYVNPATCSHTFGEWAVTYEPTCTAKGLKERSCSLCNTVQSEILDMAEHTFGEFTVTKEADCYKEGKKSHVCSTCNFNETVMIEKTQHNYGSDNICTLCEDRKYGTEGLLYELQGNKDPYPGTYKCSSIGTAIMEKNIYIAAEYNGKAVTYIAGDAFSGFEIESVVIPASIKEISSSAFTDCTELKTVTFRSGIELKVLQGFQRCTSLTSITVPASVERVAVNAFWGCEALNSMSFELTEGWYCGYHNSPRSEETSVGDTYKNANTVKHQGSQYYFFRLVAPE